MYPVVAIVGRPNVGKSTLFNRLIGERRAIVLGTPGVTRDRNYGECQWHGRTFTVIDTGGLEPHAEVGVEVSIREQAMIAMEEADVVVAVFDGRGGLTPADNEVIDMLRRQSTSVVFTVNKIDGLTQAGLIADFYETGIDHAFPISAEHGRGIGDLLEEIVDRLPPPSEAETADDAITRVALIGRPNVGKSTLANRMLGEDRMITSDVPGTTRDAIDTRLVWDDHEYVLIDTAGLRRKRGIKRDSSEGFSVMRTLRAIERCHVAVHLIDGTEGVTDQDARIAGIADEKGRALILAVNKWDAVTKDAKTAQNFQESLRLKLPFTAYAPVVFMSGLTGQRVPRLMRLVEQVRTSHLRRISTGPLNRWLEQTAARHQPPVVRGRRVKFYFATQASTAPPTVFISTNEPEGVHFSYRRFLVNQFRASFDVEGTPIRLVFRGKSSRDEED